MRGAVTPAPRVPRRRRPPRYAYRLADLDELFANAEARSEAAVEQRRDRLNRRSNWRVLGVVLIVAMGLAVVAAGVLDRAVTFVMNVFGA